MSMASPSLIELLLQQQQGLSAVDEFSTWHGEAMSISSRYQALMPTASPAPGQQYAFEVDLDTCSGCKSCVVACHNLNGLDESETWRKVGLLTSKSASLPIVQHVTTACHHCVEPGCMNGCPVLAYEKDAITGIVRHLDDQCFGCQYCIMMCPYEVPQYNHTLGIVRKCDMCSQRLAVGEAPACVQACPNQAIQITIVNLEAIQRENSNNATLALVPSSPPSNTTLPTTRYIHSRHALNETRVCAEERDFAEVVSSDSLLDRPQHGHWPLALMLVFTQASVGMFFVLFFWLLIQPLNAENTTRSFTFKLSLMATIIGVVGVHLALLHLGRPMYAFRAFLGWRKSWLSREAILFGFYMAATVTTCAAIWFASSLTAVIPGIFVIGTAFSGGLAVLSSGMIYVATKRSQWNMKRTFCDFGLTTLGLGAAGAATLCDSPEIGWILGCSGLVLIIGSCAFSISDWYVARKIPSNWKDFSARSGRLLRGDLSHLWSLQWAFMAGGLLIAAAMLSLESGGVTEMVGRWSLFFSLVIAKFISRFLYFASIVTHRMPGAES